MTSFEKVIWWLVTFTVSTVLVFLILGLVLSLVDAAISLDARALGGSP